MCVDLGWATDEDSAGFVAGYLQSSNALARIFTASPWGVAAGQFGRKSCLILTLASITLGGLAFGFCTDLVAAVAIRALFFGLGNGWVTLFAPLCIDIAGPIRQTEVIGKVLATGSLVQLFGPAIGGWTYGVTSHFPGALPSFVTALFGCVVMCLCWRWIPECMDKCNNHGRTHQEDKAEVPWCKQVCAWPINIIIILRVLNGFIEWAQFDLLPLWAISSTEVGGLALPQTELGYMLSICGMFNIVFSLYLLPYLMSKLGLRRAGVFAAAVTAVACAGCPFSPDFASGLVFQIILVCTKATTITACTAMTNNAVEERSRSAISGVTVMFECLGKGLAPMVIASSFAWSISRWGRDGHFVPFFALAILSLISAIAFRRLPDQVEHQVSPDHCATQKTCEDTKALKSDAACQPGDLSTVDIEVKPMYSEEIKSLTHDSPSPHKIGASDCRQMSLS